MMITLRVVATSASFPSACLFDAPRRRSDAENPRELLQVADLEGRGPDARGERRGVPIDPHRVHPDALSPRHVDVGAVAHVQRLAGAHAEPAQRGLEDHGLGLPPAYLIGHHPRLEQVGDAFAFQDPARRRRVVEVGDHRETMPLSELAQEQAVVRREYHGLGQLPHVRGEKRGDSLGGQRGHLEPETPDEQTQALGRRDLAVGLAPHPFRLLPAPHEGLDEIGQLDTGGEGPEGPVEMAGGGADDLAVEAHLGEPGPVERDQGVEEIEKNRVVAHGNGFLCASPSSSPCQKRTSDSPTFQQRFTVSSSTTPGKSTSPISRSLVTPPSARTSCRIPRTSMARPSRRSALAFQSRWSISPPPEARMRACSAWRWRWSAVAWRWRSSAPSISPESLGIRLFTWAGVKRRSLTAPPRRSRARFCARGRRGSASLDVRRPRGSRDEVDYGHSDFGEEPVAEAGS